MVCNHLSDPAYVLSWKIFRFKLFTSIIDNIGLPHLFLVFASGICLAWHVHY